MAARLRRVLARGNRAPWLAIWPAVALSLAVFGFSMLGDAQRDLLRG